MNQCLNHLIHYKITLQIGFLIINYRHTCRMNKKDLAELLRYSNPYSILVVTYENRIIELCCPFWVQVKFGVGDLNEGDKVQVDMVKLSFELKTVFVIKGVPFYFWHFSILIKKDY